MGLLSFSFIKLISLKILNRFIFLLLIMFPYYNFLDGNLGHRIGLEFKYFLSWNFFPEYRTIFIVLRQDRGDLLSVWFF